MHQSNLAREAGRDTIDDAIKKKELIKLFTDGILVGLSDTTSHGDRPANARPGWYSKCSVTAKPTYCASPTT